MYKDIEKELGMNKDSIPIFLYKFQNYNSNHFRQIIPSFKGRNYGLAFYIEGAFFVYTILDAKQVKKIGITNEMR